VDVRDKGVWMQAQLDQQSDYFGAIRQLVEEGKLYLSSGSVEHLVQINARTRHVDVWPIIEGSLTPTPANLLADIPVKTFRAAVPSLPTDLADDATITHRAVTSLYERSYEDIYGDIMALINPPPLFGDMPQTYNTIDALFADHVIICRYDSDGDDSYWDIPYTLDADLEPVLDEGNAVLVDKGYVPATARSAELPLTIAATDTLRHVAALTVRTKDYGERRYREGRMLSASNLKTISETADGLEMHARTLRDLHQRASGEAEDAARAAYYADPDARRLQIAVLDL
jgi:hypothetical protein